MTLRTKTFLALLPVIVVVVLAVLFGVSRQFELLLRETVEDEAELLIQANRKALEQHARVATSALAKQVRRSVATVDVTALNDAIRDAEAVYGATQIVVLSKAGLLLADGSRGVGVRPYAVDDPTVRRALTSTRVGVSWRADGLASWAPVAANDVQIGAVVMKFDLGDFHEFRRGSQMRGAERMRGLTRAVEEQFVFFLIASIFIAMLAAALIASITTRRTVLIAEAAEAAGKGDLSTRVDVTGSDELSALARRFNEMLAEIETSRDALAQHERERRELEIARRIQTSVLPAMPAKTEVYELDALMVTADEVGGDYYDVVEDQSGNCWIAVGDVSGHGLVSGLVMLMCQVALRVAVVELDNPSPSDVFSVVNRLLVENVRQRLDGREHMTLVVLRCGPDGEVDFAGGHEDLICVRVDGSHEVIAAPGPWAGVMDPIPQLPVSKLHLDEGDRLWLHTDGITESRSEDGELFGIERLIELVARNVAPADVVAVAQEFGAETTDDLACLTVRRSAG